ncbi:hypothetical protein M8C21_027189, partial [Ambrosia artemisiifolia]
MPLPHLKSFFYPPPYIFIIRFTLIWMQPLCCALKLFTLNHRLHQFKRIMHMLLVASIVPLPLKSDPEALSNCHNWLKGWLWARLGWATGDRPRPCLPVGSNIEIEIAIKRVMARAKRKLDSRNGSKSTIRYHIERDMDL